MISKKWIFYLYTGFTIFYCLLVTYSMIVGDLRWKEILIGAAVVLLIRDSNKKFEEWQKSRGRVT